MIVLRMIVLPMLPEWPPLNAAAQGIVAGEIAGFVRRNLARAPAHVRAGVLVVSIGLVFWQLLRAPLAAMGSPARRRALVSCQRIQGQVSVSAVVRLYRSLTVLAFYEHPLVVAAMGTEDPAARQNRFRVDRDRLLAIGRL
jgi:hypothetical protein